MRLITNGIAYAGVRSKLTTVQKIVVTFARSQDCLAPEPRHAGSGRLSSSSSSLGVLEPALRAEVPFSNPSSGPAALGLRFTSLRLMLRSRTPSSCPVSVSCPSWEINSWSSPASVKPVSGDRCDRDRDRPRFADSLACFSCRALKSAAARRIKGVVKPHATPTRRNEST